MNTKSDAQILEDAAAIIECNGWYQGNLAGGAWTVAGGWYEAIEAGAPCCILGAINVAAGEGVFMDPWPLGEFVTGNPSPGVWNDAPGRTKEEVLTALRDAAQRAREVSA